MFNQNRNNRFNQMMGRENMRWGQNMDRYNIATEQRAMRLAEQQAQDARKMQAYGMLSGSFMPPGMPQFHNNPTYGIAAPDVIGMLTNRAGAQAQSGQNNMNFLMNLWSGFGGGGGGA